MVGFHCLKLIALVRSIRFLCRFKFKAFKLVWIYLLLLWRLFSLLVCFVFCKAELLITVFSFCSWWPTVEVAFSFEVCVMCFFWLALCVQLSFFILLGIAPSSQWDWALSFKLHSRARTLITSYLLFSAIFVIFFSYIWIYITFTFEPFFYIIVFVTFSKGRERLNTKNS